MNIYRDEAISRSDLRFVLINIVSFCLLSLLVFYRHEAVLFLRNDGFFQLVLEKNLQDWMSLRPLLTTDFLKGMGEILFPTLTRLSPGFVIGRWLEGDNLAAISMTVFALQLFVGTIVMGALMRFRTPIVMFGAWAACLVTLPYFVPTLTYIRIWGNPNFTTTIAITAIALGLFYRLGRNSVAKDALLAVLIAVLYAVLIVVQPVVFVMAAPLIIVMSAVFLLTAEDRTELARKAVLGGAVALVLSAAFFGYLYDLFIFSKTTFFWAELYAPTVDPSDISFFTQRHETAGNLGVVLLVAAPCAAIFAIRQGGHARRLGLAYLVFFALLVMAVVYISISSGVWRGPPPGYLEMMSLPFQGLFWGAGCWLALENRNRVLSRIRWRFPPVSLIGNKPWQTIAVAMVVLPWIALPVSMYRADRLTAHGPWPWPLKKTEVVSLIADEIALSDGSPFRGRVVNLAGAEGSYDIAFINQHIYDSQVLHTTHNDHRQYGFWYFNVPTLMSGNQFTSPFFYLVSTRFLKPAGTKSIRAHMAMQKFDERILSNLGVRFVIDDKPHPDSGRLRLKSKLPTGKTFYVYELNEPNTGNRSPTAQRPASDAKEMLRFMADPEFNFNEKFVADARLPDNLVKAHFSDVRTRRGGLWISARSRGTSVLVLPFEYSHCLVASFANEGAAPVSIFRANLNQTGLLFSGDIEGTLINRFGPLVEGRCRNKDIQDAYRLGLDRLTGWWPTMEPSDARR